MNPFIVIGGLIGLSIAVFFVLNAGLPVANFAVTDSSVNASGYAGANEILGTTPVLLILAVFAALAVVGIGVLA